MLHESGNTTALPAPYAARSAPRPKGALIDSHCRVIDHLRLSVTAACDLRCAYCLPNGFGGQVRRPGDLTDRQRLEFVRFLVERYGLSQIRITGGEPLICDSVSRLIEHIKDEFPALCVALTTNGQLLAQCACRLRRAGLDRINVSLDSLDPDCYRRLTGGNLHDVLSGLAAAASAGFEPPKLNTVVIRGFNDGEIGKLSRWAIHRGHEIRFLEAMPIGPARDFNQRGFVSGAQVRSDLAREFQIQPIPGAPGATARRFRIWNGELDGVVGTIAPVTEPFCSSCRRLRITADGKLYPCLLDPRHVDMRAAWKGGRFDPLRAEELLGEAVSGKQAHGTRQSTAMIQLGG